MKVGWLLALGPEAARREALGRLEVVADTFLSMNAPGQLALPRWLAGARGIQEQILGRVRENLGAAAGLEVLPVEAGWSAVVRMPYAEDAAVSLVREAGVVVHPGAFYGMAGGRFVVISTLGGVEGFGKGVKLMEGWCEARGLT